MLYVLGLARWRLTKNNISSEEKLAERESRSCLFGASWSCAQPIQPQCNGRLQAGSRHMHTHTQGAYAAGRAIAHQFRQPPMVAGLNTRGGAKVHQGGVVESQKSVLRARCLVLFAVLLLSALFSLMIGRRRLIEWTWTLNTRLSWFRFLPSCSVSLRPLLAG